MLVHHFGTRDALIAGALEIARRRQLGHVADYFAPRSDAATVLESAWPWLVDPETSKYFRLFQQVAALEKLQDRAAPSELRVRLGNDWKPMFRGVFAADPRHRDDAEALAELLLAIYRGFAVQMVTQRDKTRLRPAYERFIELLQMRPSGVAPPPQ